MRDHTLLQAIARVNRPYEVDEGEGTEKRKAERHSGMNPKPSERERLAVLAPAHSDPIYARAQRAASENLALLDGLMAEHSDILRWHRPHGGMTAFPWIEGVRDTLDFCEALLKRGVMIAPGDCLGMPSHFRLGFAAAGPQFALALERVAAELRHQLRAASGG